MKRQKKIKLGLLLLIGCILGIINMSMHIQASSMNWNLKTVVQVEKIMELTFIPVLSGTKEDSSVLLQDWMVTQALSLSGVLTCYHDNRMLSDSSIDVATEEWIQEAQAWDENYIDENGDLVGEDVHGDTSLEVEVNSHNDMVSSSETYIPHANMDKLVDKDYLLSHYYVVDKTVKINYDMFDADTWMKKDMSLQQEVEGPQILIYHTHSQEAFTDSTEGDLDTTIVGVGDYLTEVLEEEYGIEVLHHREVYDLVDGVLDRSTAYELAGKGVSKVLEENPSIEFVIDLHRDGVDQHTHLVTMINDEPTAQIMFFNGLSSTLNNGNLSSLPNPYIMDNLALSFQMQLAAEELYPGFTRKIYLKSYRYNLHLMPKCMLIEAGAQTNSLDEMYNAMDVLADVLNAVIG